MDEIVHEAFTRSCVKFEFKFTNNDYSFSQFGQDRKMLMPSSITLVDTQKNSNSHWAILQAFQENVQGHNNELLVDNICSTKHKCGSKYEFTKQPPFYTSYRVGSFSDRPTYDCSYDGNIMFYTILSEMEGDVLQDTDSLFRCKYYCSEGFNWGLERKESKVRSLPVKKMERNEIDKILNVFRKHYPCAVFVSC